MILQFHKSGTTSDPKNFRPIALSNCDGKLFFSFFSKSFTSYMISNQYFDKQHRKDFCFCYVPRAGFFSFFETFLGQNYRFLYHGDLYNHT